MALPKQSSYPELIFGLVAPVGVDLDLVTQVLIETLTEMHYQAEADSFRLTHLMRQISLPLQLPNPGTPYIQSIRQRIEYANAIRKALDDDALAALAVTAIRSFRKSKRAELLAAGAEEATQGNSEREEEKPLPKQAYIIRQFKRPEEIALLRRVYGQQFILVSAYAPLESRRRRIASAERQSRGGLVDDTEAQSRAYELVIQDAAEETDFHGQNVRDAFPLGDVFIDASSRSACETTLRRFIHLFFGDNEITPMHDEYGMYIAKAASLRSADLSRQVGAAIFRKTDEIVALGCNEVPKAGGGSYWPEDERDGRDFVQGHDPNDFLKREILVDLLDRLKRKEHLSNDLQKTEDPYEIAKKLLEDESTDSVSQSRLMDIIEFGRIIHAEMAAITDAARKGVAVDGGTLFCTTFPCHLCAKHIVAAGLCRVVFLEPYPKSYASELHRDSIAIEHENAQGKVAFDPFIGVAPARYRNLFEKGKRKFEGRAQKWNKNECRPMLEIYFPSYFEAETFVVARLAEGIASLDAQAAKLANDSASLADIKPDIPMHGAGPAPTE